MTVGGGIDWGAAPPLCDSIIYYTLLLNFSISSMRVFTLVRRVRPGIGTQRPPGGPVYTPISKSS